MKNTIRARRNGGKTSRPSQAQTQISEPGINNGSFAGDQPIALTVFSHKKDKTLAGCDISQSAWDHLCKIAQASGVSVGTLLNNIVQGILVAQPMDDSPFRPVVVNGAKIRDMEDAKDQSDALHILLHDFSKEQAKNGSYCDSIQSGIVGLISDTHAKMDKIYSALEKARFAQMARGGAQ